MYKKSCSSATSFILRRAYNSSSSSPSITKPLSSLVHPHSSIPSVSNQYRSFSVFRSLPRWSHGVDWKSPASLRSQIRIASPLLERLERTFATMASEHAFKGILTNLPKPGGGEFGKFYSLPAMNDPRIEKLPYSIRILLESAIRNCDNFQVTKEDVEKIIDWENTSPKLVEIPFKPARVLLQDFTGVPAVVDLACMRDAMNKLGSDSNKINPLVPVDLVIDHSVQVDVTRSENAVQANMELEFQRNKERFAFLKWGSNAFHNMLVVPPGSGIVHQVNLEYLGRVVFSNDGILYPDSVVGTDSHTTMIDGLGVAGWGVGGIEAEAAMLGQPMSMVLPGVVGFKLSGKLRNGVTATDLVLTVTQMLRKHGVVGKFVEFYGDGMGELSLADRATIANMSPEYGATMGFFPVDHVTLQYLKLTGRSDDTVAMIEAYLRANKMFVDYNEPQQERAYSSYLSLDLEEVEPCVSGPKSFDTDVFYPSFDPMVTPETLPMHPVRELQERCQQQAEGLEYKATRSGNLATVEVYIDGIQVGTAQNQQKKMAQKLAARNALVALKEKETAEANKEKRDEDEKKNSGTQTFTRQTLNDICLRRNWPMPLYRCVNEGGPAHAKRFTFAVRVNTSDRGWTDECVGEPMPSVKKAKDSAAVLLLELLNNWYA